MWECQKVISVKRPKYLLLENVKNLVGKKHRHNFDKWLQWLESQGYQNYWQVLNARDYGIPQNRERVFVVSVLSESDVGYKFPEKQELKVKLKDLLDEKVPDKYYFKTDRAKKLISIIVSENDVEEVVTCDATLNEPKVKDVCNCITARYDAGIQNQKSIGMSVVEPTTNFDNSDIIHCIGSTQKNAAITDGTYSPCLTSAMGQGGGHVPMPVYKNKSSYYKVRKLTPLECWRLMGFSDEDFHKAEQVNSNTQLYRQAGNSIVAKVLEEIFGKLFEREVSKQNKVIKIHTDGGCRGNQFDTNIGGIGIVARSFIDNELISTSEYKKAYSQTTNNRMELTAIITSLELCSKFLKDIDIEIYTDSEITVKGYNEWIDGWIKRGWRKSNKKPVENKDLWQRLIELSKQGNVKIMKTKGHADDKWNNRADKLVNEAMDEFEE